MRANRAQGDFLSILFHLFPGGRTGAGLLLLRVVLGAAALYQSGTGLVAGANAMPGARIADLLFAASAIMLIVGILTPCASAALAILEVVTRSFIAPASNVLPCTSFIAIVVGIAAVVLVLGPGALSLDARLFGLREIIIPGSRVGTSSDHRADR